MSHFSRVQKIVVDVPGHDAERTARFWSGATGAQLTHLYPETPEYVGADLPYGEHFTFLVQRLGEGEPRIHLDIHTDDLEAEVTRLEGLGAVRIRKVHTWWVMRDPVGLAFCVLPTSAGSLTDENAVRWE
jgi:hypothetical protein